MENPVTSNKKHDFVIMKKELDYEYSLLEEFYEELKEKLKKIISDYNIDDTTSFFLIKMFRLETPKTYHFDLISFIERAKDFSDKIFDAYSKKNNEEISKSKNTISELSKKLEKMTLKIRYYEEEEIKNLTKIDDLQTRLNKLENKNKILLKERNEKEKEEKEEKEKTKQIENHIFQKNYYAENNIPQKINGNVDNSKIKTDRDIEISENTQYSNKRYFKYEEKDNNDTYLNQFNLKSKIINSNIKNYLKSHSVNDLMSRSWTANYKTPQSESKQTTAILNSSKYFFIFFLRKF